jgi:hypothetical protein
MPWGIDQSIDFQDPKVDGLMKGGLTLGGDYYDSSAREGLVGRSLSRMIPGVADVMETYHNYLFQDFIPRVKMTMARHALERNMERYKGERSNEWIYRKTADEEQQAGDPRVSEPLDERQNPIRSSRS